MTTGVPERRLHSQTPGSPGVCYNAGMVTTWSSKVSGRLIVLAVGALGLFLWGFSFQMRVATLPSGFAWDAMSYPATVQGIAAGSRREVLFLVEGLAPGTPVTIVPDGAPPVEVRLRPAGTNAYLAVTCFSGLFFWLVCATVFLPRYRDPHVPSFLWILLLYGCAVMMGGVYYQTDLLAPGSLFGFVQLTCLAVLPPAFLRLTLTFPERATVLDRRRWLMPSQWGLAAVLVLWQAVTFADYFRRPGPETAARLVAPQNLADLVMLATVAVAFGVLIRSVRRLGPSRAGKQIRWLLWGFAVGAAPYLALRTLPQLLGLTPPLPAGADRVLELAVPLSFVFAVVWEQFLDIDVIIRRSLLYSGLALALVAILLLPALVFAENLGGPAPGWPTALLLAAGLAAGLAFVPLRARLGYAIDRFLFGLGHDDDARLERLVNRFGDLRRPEDVVDELGTALHRRLGCRHWGVEVWPADGPQASLAAVTGVTSDDDLDDDAFPPAWRRRDYVLARRFRRAGAGDAVILVGPRHSGRRYVPEDLAFLTAATDAAESAWERLHLLRAVAAQTEARQRLDEMNRLKSRFLAQAAHDLRTPVTSVTWSARNLLDGLAGELNPRQREYIDSIRDATGHLDTLVGNLLQVSRLEQATVVPVLADFDLAPRVASAVSSVRPLAESADVAISVDAPEGLRLHADAEKVVEALVNVLDNAIKYSPPGGTIRVTCRADAPGSASIAVRDEGPGLGDLADPFARYVQGRPSPHSSRHGFGLGLHIVKQYMDMMGGTVWGQDAPTGGAVFTLTLPAAGGKREVAPCVRPS